MPKYTVTLTVEAESAAEALSWVTFDDAGDVSKWWETVAVKPVRKQRPELRLAETHNEEEN